jgi:ankyrin repeat protein
MCWLGDSSSMAILLYLVKNRGIDPDTQNHSGKTPFHLLIKNDAVVSDVTSFYNSCHVDPDRPDIEGRTPFYTACSQGRVAIVQFLYETSRVDPDRPDKEGKTPFMVACSKGHWEVVIYLIERCQVDPFQRDSSGQEIPIDVLTSSGSIRDYLLRMRVQLQPVLDSGLK